jgi:hypothetical protein
VEGLDAEVGDIVLNVPRCPAAHGMFGRSMSARSIKIRISIIYNEIFELGWMVGGRAELLKYLRREEM